MDVILRSIQYQPGRDEVTLLLELPIGRFTLTTTQTALAARAPGGAEVWGGPDDAALAEAQALLDGTASPATQAMIPGAMAAQVVGKGWTVLLAGAPA